MSEEHPHVTGRESAIILCAEFADGVQPQGPTEEYPYFLSIRSQNPLCMAVTMAALTPEFYEYIKDFPQNPDLQKEFKDVFKGHYIENE